MADGNNGSPYRRAHNRGGGGHFSPMHATGASSGAASNMFEESGNDAGLFSGEQNLWDNFESVACSVTDLYRNPNWNVFQRTAAATTQFYKDSVDAYRRGTDAGMTIGRQILCKEMLHWLQTSNQSHSPFIRRDELINYVLTRAMMATPNTSESGAGQSPTSTNVSEFGNSSPMQTQPHQDTPSISHNDEPLEIFQEALAMPPGSTRHQNTASANGLTAFFVEECRRHANGKRRRLSPEHHPYYYHSSHDSSPEGNGGNGSGSYWHARPSKRSRRL